MYDVLGQIYNEMVELFSPIDLFHYGGDEVEYALKLCSIDEKELQNHLLNACKCKAPNARTVPSDNAPWHCR